MAVGSGPGVIVGVGSGVAVGVGSDTGVGVAVFVGTDVGVGVGRTIAVGLGDGVMWISAVGDGDGLNTGDTSDRMTAVAVEARSALPAHAAMKTTNRGRKLTNIALNAGRRISDPCRRSQRTDNPSDIQERRVWRRSLSHLDRQYRVLG